MASSRLFELLAQAKARPSGAFTDAISALGAGKNIVDEIQGVKEFREGNKTLDELFGDSIAGSGLEGVKVRQLKDSPLLKVFDILEKNKPVPSFSETLDEKGNVVRTRQEDLPPRAKVSKFSPPVSINLGAKTEANIRQGTATSALDTIKTLRREGRKATPEQIQSFRQAGINPSTFSDLEPTQAERDFKSDFDEARALIAQKEIEGVGFNELRDIRREVANRLLKAHPKQANKIQFLLDQ